MDARIRPALDGPILSITIDRPDKRNALDGPMFDALANALRLAQDESSVHCVMLRGSGHHFCSGHDLAAFGTLWPQEEHGVIRRCIAAFAQQSKPLLAAVNGAAVGFGATMLLHADWIVAGEGATFRFPFTDLGIVPEAGATALLARRVGDLTARDWLMSGRTIAAAEALRHGFVSCVVPDADVSGAADAYAARLAAKPAHALLATRRLLLDGAVVSVHEAIAREFACLNRFIPAVHTRSISHG